MDFEGLLKKMERDGTIFDVTQQRSMLLQSGMGFPVDKEVEWVVITGCYNLLLFTPVLTFGKLLKEFGVSYTFLSKEYCCGHPLVTEAEKEGKSLDEMRSLGQGGKELMGKNLEAAKKLGAKGMVTVCPGCLCMSQEYPLENGMEVIYIVDFISRYFQEGKLSMSLDFYEGCHKLHNHFPSFSLDMNGAKSLLNRIQGLEVNEIPRSLCCLKEPAEIFERAKTKLITTPSPCCYFFLNNARPKDGTQVKYLGEVLCQSREM